MRVQITTVAEIDSAEFKRVFLAYLEKLAHGENTVIRGEDIYLKESKRNCKHIVNTAR